MSSANTPSVRRVVAQHPARRDDIGDLVTRRPLPGPGLDQLDPFLFLNHHGPQVYPANNQGLPFGPHPHRGFETVTFILEGSLAHADSAKHQSVIHAGGVQWMTAGSGIVHAEISPEAFLRAADAAARLAPRPRGRGRRAPRPIGRRRRRGSGRHRTASRPRRAGPDRPRAAGRRPARPPSRCLRPPATSTPAARSGGPAPPGGASR